MKTRRIVVTAMLLAILLIMGFVPYLGFIQIGPIALTLLTIPVIVGTLCEGLAVGTFLSLAFGVVSLVQAYLTPTPTSFLFWDPLVAILPRVLIGPVAWLVARPLMRRDHKVAIGLAALAGSLTNTVGVLAMIGIRHGEAYAEILGRPVNELMIALSSIAAANGLPEAILAVIVCIPIVLAVNAIQRRTRKKS